MLFKMQSGVLHALSIAHSIGRLSPQCLPHHLPTAAPIAMVWQAYRLRIAMAIQWTRRCNFPFRHVQALHLKCSILCWISPYLCFWSEATHQTLLSMDGTASKPSLFRHLITLSIVHSIGRLSPQIYENTHIILPAIPGCIRPSTLSQPTWHRIRWGRTEFFADRQQDGSCLVRFHGVLIILSPVPISNVSTGVLYACKIWVIDPVVEPWFNMSCSLTAAGCCCECCGLPLQVPLLTAAAHQCPISLHRGVQSPVSECTVNVWQRTAVENLLKGLRYEFLCSML
jgi:hypothetical protein